jgi:hypothetical protein
MVHNGSSLLVVFLTGSLLFRGGYTIPPSKYHRTSPKEMNEHQQANDDDAEYTDAQ